MKTIAFEKGGVIYTQVFTDENTVVEFDHIVLENPPTEPQESWYIEDRQIKIDQQKLVEFNRKNMPTLTPIEFDIKLNNAGLYDAVQDLIKDNFELRIAYNRATFFNRTDPFIDQARIALGLTDEQVDEIWTS
jgi:hypothetical protein